MDLAEREMKGGEITIAEVETQHPANSTLLPATVANAVSLVTRSSSLYLRVGKFLGGLALDGARVTTLTGLELSRALIEGILTRAGRDVTSRSTGELGRAEAESMLERSLATLHSTITNISFAASTGFYFSSAALSSATDISQQLLASLDSILGSTDSSRAIASIVTLIRREFQNPATGVEGEKVSVADLLVGICGLALLHRWSHKLTALEHREGRYEEVLWDVVMLDNGSRVDVVGDNTEYNGAINDQRLGRRPSLGAASFMTPGGAELVQTIERDGRHQLSPDDMPENTLKEKIMQSLPADASISITTTTSTTKTITVEISGAHPQPLSLPPGVQIIEESIHHTKDVSLDEDACVDDEKVTFSEPTYKIVYRIAHEKVRGTNILASGPIDDTEEAVEDDTVPLAGMELHDSLRSPVEFEPSVLPKPDTVVFGPSSERSSTSSKTPRRSLSLASDNEITSPSGAVSRPEIVANQKRSRMPMSSPSTMNEADQAPLKKYVKQAPSKNSKSEKTTPKPPEKKGSFRAALRRGSGTTLSSLWNKEQQPAPLSPAKPASRPAWTSPGPSSLPLPQRGSSIVPAQTTWAPQRGNPNYFSSRDLGISTDTRSPSRTSFYSVHEHRRDSLVSQTDTYSIHSADTRPGSPTAFRAHFKASSRDSRARVDKNVAKPPASPLAHRRVQSCVPSIYTMKTNNSDVSLVLAPRSPRGAFDSSESLESLMRTGFVDGMFPQRHLVSNITRFVRFASASYGASFLRVMGIVTAPTGMKEIDNLHHHEHHSFSNHTQLPPDSILLSSFVDPQGGTDSSGYTNTGVPMVHFVSLDHASKAVVLTCRGTLGFEDVLADMTCDYDDLVWRGKAYKVHKGIHASARRLCGGRVLATIKAALEEFPEYGLVMCGHSLGGGVTTILAIMLSEPASQGSSFVTSATSSPLLITNGNTGTASTTLELPPGRPIHVYAYGPPATVSPSLRLATRGLITTIVNGQDLVPHLSLGILHDLQAVALAFKTDDTGAKGEVRKRVWQGLTAGLTERVWGRNDAKADEDEIWAYSALKVLRASMLSAKLVPPGEVFVVETMPVLKRNAFSREAGESAKGWRTNGDEGGLGRPATRSVLKYVRDVEKRFGEVRWGGSMLLDHSPGRYEASLGALGGGVLGDGRGR